MKIQAGHPLTNDIQEIEATRLRFLTDSGEDVFEIAAGKDGRSIEVRGVMPYSHGPRLFSERLEIQPVSSNLVVIKTKPFNICPICKKDFSEPDGLDLHLAEDHSCDEAPLSPGDADGT